MLNMFVLGHQGCSKGFLCDVPVVHLLLGDTVSPPLSFLFISLYGL
jgi:hypothetical protein